jgi:hypothetical protein
MGDSASLNLRATLDKVPRSRDRWIQVILLVESFKLVPRSLDEGQRPKSGKIEAKRFHMAPVLEGESIGSDQKTSAKRRARDLENQKSG